MIIGGIATAIPAVLTMGIALPRARTSILSRVVSLLFLAGVISLNIVGSLFSFSLPLTIILNAAPIIVYAVILRGMWSAAQ